MPRPSIEEQYFTYDGWEQPDNGVQQYYDCTVTRRIKYKDKHGKVIVAKKGDTFKMIELDLNRSSLSFWNQDPDTKEYKKVTEISVKLRFVPFDELEQRL